MKKTGRIFWFLTGICIGIMPYVMKVAVDQRGYHAIGGEIFIIAVPFLLLIIKDTIRQIALEVHTYKKQKRRSLRQKKLQRRNISAWDVINLPHTVHVKDVAENGR